jgi:putative NADPH-quinone reductase
MTKRVLLLQGHPDPAPERLCRALADAYEAGARQAGHALRRIDIGALDFPFLRNKEAFETGAPPAPIKAAQNDLLWAEHVVLIYPLWLGAMPAFTKAFFEQTLRPGFAFVGDTARGQWKKALKGKSARIVVTMGMPALVYRLFYRAHSLKSLERNVLAFVGIGPVRETLFGLVETKGRAEKALAHMQRLGAQGY